jgi:predicted DsbA family dithiol-disulfide isomerase
MAEITVFSDVSCPFAYVGFTRILALRDAIGPAAPPLRARAWPLEIVNGEPLAGPALVPKVEALRRDVAPDLFTGFDPERFPRTTLHALAAEHAAFRVGTAVGMAFSLAIRRLLFEEGADVGDPDVVARLLDAHALPRVRTEDRQAVDRDYAEGVERGVVGSPHFFTPSGDFFCPTLDIRSTGEAYEVEFDPVGFDRFIRAAFG